jgi:hypothetical protein
MRRTPHVLALAVSILMGTAILSLHNFVFASATYECPSNLGAAASATVGDYCYALFTTAKSWSNAKTSCESISGGKLATIHSSTVNSAVKSVASGNEVWIGAADNNSLISGSSEGNFYWILDSNPFWTGGQAGSAYNGAYQNWEPLEPNDSGANEDCVEMYTTGTWNDYVCSNGRYYVCELPAVQSSSSSSIDAEVTLTHGGGRRTSTLQSLVDRAVQKRTSGNLRGAAASQAPVVSAQSSNIGAMCARLKFATASPVTQAQINDMMMKKYQKQCQ